MNGEPTKVRDVLRGRHALVTGSSSGLGVEFARELARRGCDLTLVARREDRLQALRQELCARYGVKVFVVPADLTAPGATQRLYEEAKESGKPVDVLQRVALLLTHPDQQCTTLAQESSWANVAARMVGMVQLHCKPL